jgi:hypothetical protein
MTNTSPADRVAGLLVLLYAQKLSDITALTAQHVLREDSRTLLHLGSRPVVLPAPLDALVTRLADDRKTPGRGLLSTALFTLAADVPAAILARTLGIHIQAAVQWQKISAGDWAAYAADVGARLAH